MPNIYSICEALPQHPIALHMAAFRLLQGQGKALRQLHPQHRSPKHLGKEAAPDMPTLRILSKTCSPSNPNVTALSLRSPFIRSCPSSPLSCLLSSATATSIHSSCVALTQTKRGTSASFDPIYTLLKALDVRNINAAMPIQVRSSRPSLTRTLSNSF